MKRPESQSLSNWIVWLKKAPKSEMYTLTSQTIELEIKGRKTNKRLKTLLSSPQKTQNLYKNGWILKAESLLKLIRFGMQI